MKIGIISDTHNRLDLTKETLSFLHSANIDLLIHAGDIGIDVLNFLKSSNINYIAVLGNTDKDLLPFLGKENNLFREPYYFIFENKKFKLMHHPYYLSADSDVIIYGHTHHFKCEKRASLYINPGEVCAREKARSECAIFDLKNFFVYYCYKELDKNSWQLTKEC
ncbi:MAG TPA: YfcE family phosphodiesterase [Campylobacterales bacterium]|nr:YfcE family phosphodiesterase [Campylobacterales bacterium]